MDEPERKRNDPGAVEQTIERAPNVSPYSSLRDRRTLDRDAAKDIAALPLEHRYIWRIASALHMALANFDSASAAVDRVTLPPDELSQVIELMIFRPVQFCLFVKELVGLEQMERLMTYAIEAAKKDDS